MAIGRVHTRHIAMNVAAFLNIKMHEQEKNTLFFCLYQCVVLVGAEF